jgi:outer membrane protein OmpA-like peptidoglycan-associated protein
VKTRESLIAAAAVLGVLLGGAGAMASGPEMGTSLGVAVPFEDYADTADVGGTIGLWGGYRFSLAEGVSLSLLGQPQFTLLPTKSRYRDFTDDLTSMFILGVGPKLNIHQDRFSVSFGGQGGYYRDMSGPLSEDGAGWNVAGDVSYEIFRDFTLGLFARYDQANLLPSLTADRDATRRMFLGGIAVNYVHEPAPPPPPAPAPPPPPPAPVAKRKIVLRGVNFDFDKSNIRPDARPILDEAIKVLKSEPQIKITVDGYTDSIGTEAYNLKLSDRRASSVARYLEAGGIAANRLDPIGHGESDPVATNETAEGRAQNRRVELNVVGGN